MKQTVLTLLFCLLIPCLQLMAQTNNPDFMRSTGKIYVVVAVVLAMFLGIVLFLIFLDRRLTNLENQIKEND